MQRFLLLGLYMHSFKYSLARAQEDNGVSLALP